MNNRTQLMIGVALFGIVAVLFVLPEFRAGKLEDKQAETKVSEQAAAEPKKKTQVTLGPEVASEQAAAVGVRVKTLPLSAERVLAAIQGKNDEEYSVDVEELRAAEEP